ncbi:MAG: nucleotide exchange factor GrpE [Chloroflexi bacterium]|nr:nucleotide exchange factor GrpE [Chloroflexota bacterium]MCH8801198.1 nucleotide exchange factor GrpE [Chloroflexota bacterium]MCH8893320.1 nucleotide exchange factor GrpE [Chloroflexota bacterium]MCI0788260.1 nucleotide exchange factor GrpE [Chloroflexota bacterium]MCI0801076.1 nucleotide exchange factor GrpE [Chloroflexota bacterium]
MAKGPNESDGQPEEPDGQPEEPSAKPGLEQELEELLAQAGVDLDSLPLEDQVNALKSSLDLAQKEAAENLDTAQRAQAEMVNFRRRTDEDRIANSKYANSRLIANILPVLEELELAINHTEGNAEGQAGAQGEAQAGIRDSLLEGIKLIQRKLTGVLESEGVAAIEAVGLMFNPLEHEALGTEESSDVEPGYVTQILRPGFRLHDRVIRPAQVMVARAPAPEDQ